MTDNLRSPQKSSPSGRESASSAPAGERWTVWLICLGLAAVTFAIFGQTLWHGFVNYDDDRYVYENPMVFKGLTGPGLSLAFRRGSLANWDPLTTLSHMLDCQFYGLHAGGHHLTNVLLHAASAILLFLVFRKMTGSTWRSAFVAALFAVHPLHVESVAWVSERKDTLSGLFFMLTLWAYANYAKNPRFLRYLLVILFFACGLMSKSMLVTLPFVLLLLDYWPLGRISNLRFAIYEPDAEGGKKRLSSFTRCVLEKLPLIAMAAAASVLTVKAQGGAVKSLEDYPPELRLENAVVSVAAYLGQMFWPSGLAVFYPFPEHGLPVMEVVVAAVVLIGISIAAWWWRKTHPYVLVGWLWYLGMLVPVVGLVQAGAQSRADRYTYLTQIGLYFALTWLAAKVTARRRDWQMAVATTAGVAVAALGIAAFVQTSYWKDSRTLWMRTLDCMPDNVVAHNNLGQLEMKEGRTADAAAEFQKTVTIKPDYGLGHANLGSALLKQHKIGDAIDEYQLAVRLRPGEPNFWAGLGAAFLAAGRLDEAIPVLTNSLRIQPNNFEALNNLGFALFHEGRLDDATTEFLQALGLRPNSVTVQNNLAGIAWALSASTDDSVRNGPKAVELAELVDRTSGGRDPVLVTVLAAAYAEVGQFPDAIDTAQRARQLATAQGNSGVAGVARQQIEKFQAGQPFRDPSIHVGPSR